MMLAVRTGGAMLGPRAGAWSWSLVHRSRRAASGSAEGADPRLAQPREHDDYDCVIVGGGPAGLSAAIRLKQLCKDAGTDLRVCVVEKGAEIGSHILSGCVLEPRALDELLPRWKEMGAPLKQRVTKERFLMMTGMKKLLPSIRLPVPPSMNNHKNYIAGLGHFCKWLAEQAEGLGVDIYPGFGASELLYNPEGAVCGVATPDLGIAKDGRLKDNFERGMELRARVTLLAEGCRGSLAQNAMKRFGLRAKSTPQQYGIGFKEVCCD